jgi:hypothetical protein
MSTPNNLGTVDVNTYTSNTKNYFNNFFTISKTVSTNQNDALIGYFLKYTGGNRAAADALTSAIIYTARAQNIDPMSILDNFIRMPQDQIDQYLAMFLNLNRKGTSFLGINNQPIVNKYVKRAIMS